MEIIEKLEATRDRTLSYFSLTESDLGKSYGSGKWTIRQLLHHLADAETVLNERIRRGIAKPQQVVWGFDQDAWVKELDYLSYPLDLSQATFKAVRNGIIYLAQRYYHSHGQHEYVHSETGLRTLKDEFDKVVWHNEHHLSQIELALSL